MEIFLIRHTTPDIQKGTCYGQADLDVVSSFGEEASCIRQHLPADIEMVYSSPLKRCRQLAENLFPGHAIQFEDRLKEINCGEWELRLWDTIEQEALKAWMSDFVNVVIPGGESYTDLFRRTTAFFNELPRHYKRIAIVSHGGVLRSLLSYTSEVALQQSFDVFKLFYGCVIRLNVGEDGYTHSILHNPPVEKEQHRPSYI
jgi:alpha-ribazole phosphatase